MRVIGTGITMYITFRNWLMCYITGSTAEYNHVEDRTVPLTYIQAYMEALPVSHSAKSMHK